MEDDADQGKTELIELIETDPDTILNDNDKLKEIIKDHQLTILLLESKEEYYMVVKVDGDDIALVRPKELPESMQKRVQC